MPQHDMVIDNAPGLPVRADMNAAIAALVSLSSGPVEPGTMYAGQLWLDTSMTPPVIRQRNAANGAWTWPTVESINIAGAGPSGDFPVKANDVDAILLSAATANPHILLGNNVVIRKRTAEANVHAFIAQDASGVERGKVEFNMAGQAVLSAQDAAGAFVQRLIVDATSGASISNGANAGQVITTGNLSLLVEGGTNGGQTTFPIGTTILAVHAGITRCAVAAVHLSSTDGTQYTVGSGGAQLAGSWRARGGAGTDAQLMQRAS